MRHSPIGWPINLDLSRPLLGNIVRSGQVRMHKALLPEALKARLSVFTNRKGSARARNLVDVSAE